MKTEMELKVRLNEVYTEWKRLAETYGYRHPMTESMRRNLESVRGALGTLTRQEF